MAVATVPVASESRPVRAVTARHTIAVEQYSDYRCPEVREAVVERYGGVLVAICCRDVDLREGASLEGEARSYARQREADYVSCQAGTGVHDAAHPLAGLVVTLADSTSYHVVDWWDRCTRGRSWWDCVGSPACGEYAMHVRQSGLPIDNEVVYVKDRNGFGLLVHVSELELGEVTR